MDEGIGWALGVLLRAYQSSVVTVLGDLPHGPRGYHTLAAVVEGDRPSQLALAAHLGIDRTVMTYLIDDLVDAGLVERQLNPADRRQRRIVATDLGQRTLTDLERRVRAAEDRVLSALAPGEREAFRDLLHRVACEARHIDPATDPCDVADEMQGEKLLASRRGRP
ncbi:MarR family winged helix-turn-helix transcriptional regulator [Micromonospora sp. CPCC 206061]|uniref:MarR family winged helix-turn-helix transcriptional regulator n=1 Tax=Micromonospora sp. CPCC 206061 TaxID=3122410 RepID=UPI002FF2866D